jgi:DNA-binding winged helix-turn-helix (wHTH) protein
LTAIDDTGDRIRLAGEAPFGIGRLTVTPALRQVSLGADCEILEPRVMQVLVALAQADGRIVGRDELIQRCWDGRIVGDNAINRTISLLRRLAEGLGDGSFGIETVTKVGYRLVRPAESSPPRDGLPSPAPAPGAPPRWTRRRAVAAMGLAAASVGAIGAAAYIGAAPGRRRTRARALHAEGLEVQRQGEPAQIDQAVEYFRQATAADPTFAEAWGALARGYALQAGRLYGAAREPLFVRARLAANRALALDAGNRDATLALALSIPAFRNWTQLEHVLRAGLRRLPQDGVLLALLARLLCETGRWRDAVQLARSLVAREPLDPGRQQLLGATLWHSGEVEWGRATLDHAGRQWPDNGSLWAERFLLLSTEGSPADAVRMGHDHDRPRGTLPLPPAIGLVCAQALASGREADRRRAVETLIEVHRAGELVSFISMVYLARLGEIDAAFAHAYDYFLGRQNPASGRRATVPPGDDRMTAPLFWRPTAPLRADPRFAELIRTIGLDRYWRSAGVGPDYRSTPSG